MTNDMPRLLPTAFSFLLLTSFAQAGDWPQILGPTRNGVAAGEKLPEKWPAGGPAVVWKAKVGSGYAGPAVASGKAVLFHRVGTFERIEAFDAATGKSLWKADYPASYRGGIDSDLGPRCVPLIEGGQVYVFGAAGDLHCVSLATGEKKWSRSLYADYKGSEGYFGAGSTPILAGGVLLVNVGGGAAGIVGLSPATGKTLWAATEEQASYAAPAPFAYAGKPHALFVTRYNLVAIEPLKGEVAFRYPFGKRGPTVNAATPLVLGDAVFLTASFEIGAVSLKIGKPGTAPEPAWTSDDSLSSQYVTPVSYRGHLFGTHGREDVGVAELRCIDQATGRVAWSEEEFGVAHVILAGDKILAVAVKGELVLLQADPTRFRPLARTPLPGASRAMPALADGRLYLRTTAGELLCIDVNKSGEP